MISAEGFKLFAVAVVGGCVLSQSPVLAQDDRPPGPPPGRERGQMRERMFDGDPAVLRARLERRLEFVRRQQEELENALVELDARAEGQEAQPVEDVDVPDERRRRGDDGRRRADRPMDRTLDPQGDQRERRRRIGFILEFLGEHNPDMAERVRQAVRENPRMAEGIIARLAPRIDEIRELREHDPAMARLRTAELTNGWALMHASRQLSGAFNTEPRDRETIRTLRQKIEEHVTRQFEIRARIQHREIESLQERIDQAKTATEEMMANRDEIIAGHVERIVEEGQQPAQRRGPRRDR